MKRIVLFLLTNLAVVLVLGIFTFLFGLDQSFGFSYTSLVVYAMAVGFIGSTISLLMSKHMAKVVLQLKMIDQPTNSEEAWVVQTVQMLAYKANIGMPEIGIYEGAPNAFATGAFKNSALVAVSTGLLRDMSRDEVKAVLGHEVAHIANGDMVTMALMQGVVNTFVTFLSSLVALPIDGIFNSTHAQYRHAPGIGFAAMRIVFQALLGIPASMIVAWYSRQREFRADAGAGDLLGQRLSMIGALKHLGSLQRGALPKGLQSMGIAGSIDEVFATHPPIEQRIARLQQNF